MRMPEIKFEVTLGNILSTAVSLLTVATVIVTVSVYGTSMRKDIDVAVSDIRKLEMSVDRLDNRVTTVSNEGKLAVDVATQRNVQQVEMMTEVRTDVKYLRDAVARLERVSLDKSRN